MFLLEIVLSITVIFLTFAILFLMIRFFDFEKSVNDRFATLVNDINIINSIEYKTDVNQQKRIEILEKK